MEDYYYCHDCDTEISVEDINYDNNTNQDECPECKSLNVEYYVIRDLKED